MAVIWQASGTLLGSTGADITPVNPAHATNDILVLQACSRVTTETLLTPSGWTILAGPTNASTIWRSYWFWIRATSGAMANPLCDWSAATGQKYGRVHNIRGAITTGNPFAASAVTAGTADPGSATGITTTAANQFVFTLGLVADNLATAVTVTATDPATFTSRTYTIIATGNDAGSFFQDASRTNIGATGAVSHDFNGVPLAWAILIGAVTVAEAGGDVFFENDICSIEDGIKANTAAGMDGVLIT